MLDALAVMNLWNVPLRDKSGWQHGVTWVDSCLAVGLCLCDMIPAPKPSSTYVLLQVQSFTVWREQTLASQQAILQRKQGMLQSMFAPPVPLATMGGPSAAPAAGTAVKSGAERIPAGKSSK